MLVFLLPLPHHELEDINALHHKQSLMGVVHLYPSRIECYITSEQELP